METNKSCEVKEFYPDSAIQHNVKIFTIQKKMDSPSSKENLPKPSSALLEKCSQVDFSRLRSYISNPVNFCVPLQMASRILGEEHTDSDDINNLNNSKASQNHQGSLESKQFLDVEIKVKNESKGRKLRKELLLESTTFNPKWSTIQHEKAEEKKTLRILDKEPPNSIGINLNSSIAGINDKSSLESKRSIHAEIKDKNGKKKRKIRKELLNESTTFYPKWSNTQCEKSGEKKHSGKCTQQALVVNSQAIKKKICVSEEHKYGSSASTTVKLSSAKCMDRRKRGAEVLAAHFVQDVQNKRAAVDGTSYSKCVKNTSAESGLVKLKRKTTVLENGTLNDSANCNISEPAQMGSRTKSKLKVKSIKMSLKERSEKSVKTSIKNIKKIGCKNIKLQSESREKTKFEDKKCCSAIRAEEYIMEKRVSMYESHALNLLADLALNAFSSSAVISKTETASSRQGLKETDIIKAKSDQDNCSDKFNSDKTCTPVKCSTLIPIAMGTDPIQENKHNMKRSDSCKIISFLKTVESKEKQTQNVADTPPQSNSLNKICLEHSYSQPPTNEATIYLVTDKSNESSVQTLDPSVIPSVRELVFDQQQNNVNCSKEMIHVTGNNEVSCLFRKKGPRAVFKFGENLQVTLEWEGKYDLELDSKFTSDPLEKTINRALHGPWNPHLKEKVEDVKIILHMWLALFYSKPNKATSCSSRKVVEHSNPAKYVSINTVLEPVELNNCQSNLTQSPVLTADLQNSPVHIPSSNKVEYCCVDNIPVLQRLDGKEISSKDDLGVLSVSSEEKNIENNAEQMQLEERQNYIFTTYSQTNGIGETGKCNPPSVNSGRPANNYIPVLCYVQDSNQLDVAHDQNEISEGIGQMNECSLGKDPVIHGSEHDKLSSHIMNLVCSNECLTNKEVCELKDFGKSESKSTSNIESPDSLKKTFPSICEKPELSGSEYIKCNSVHFGTSDYYDNKEFSKPHSEISEFPEILKKTENILKCDKNQVNTDERQITEIDHKLYDFSSIDAPVSHVVDHLLSGFNISSGEGVKNDPLPTAEHSGTLPSKESSTNDCLCDNAYRSKINCQNNLMNSKTNICNPAIKSYSNDLKDMAPHQLSVGPLSFPSELCEVHSEELENKNESTLLSSEKLSSADFTRTEDNQSMKGFQENANKTDCGDMKAPNHVSNIEKQNIHPESPETATVPEIKEVQDIPEILDTRIWKSDLSNLVPVGTSNVQLLKERNGKSSVKEQQYPRHQAFQGCTINSKDLSSLNISLDQSVSNEGQFGKSSEFYNKLGKAKETELALVKNSGIDQSDSLKNQKTNSGFDNDVIGKEEQMIKKLKKKDDFLLNENPAALECNNFKHSVCSSGENFVQQPIESNPSQSIQFSLDCSTFPSHLKPVKEGEVVVGSEERKPAETVKIAPCINEKNICNVALECLREDKALVSGDNLLQVKHCSNVTCQPFTGSAEQIDTMSVQDLKKSTIHSVRDALDVCFTTHTADLHEEIVDDWSEKSYEDNEFGQIQEPDDAFIYHVNRKRQNYLLDYEKYKYFPGSAHESTAMLHESAISKNMRNTKHCRTETDPYLPQDFEHKEHFARYFRHPNYFKCRPLGKFKVINYVKERALQAVHRKDCYVSWPEQVSVLKEKKLSHAHTENTLDLEHLRFNYRLKDVLKNTSTDKHLCQPPFRTMFESKRIPCYSGSASKKKDPLVITIQCSNRKRHYRQYKLQEDTYYKTLPYDDVKDESSYCYSNLKKLDLCRKTPFHFQKLRYGSKLMKTNDDISLILKECVHSTHLKLNRVSLGKTERTSGIYMTEACSREATILESPKSHVVKDIISDLSTSLHCRLNKVAKEYSKKTFQFYISETSDDSFFSLTKDMLVQAGNTEAEPQQFCSNHQASDKMLVIIRNEDISCHIHKIPCLLRLRLLPNVSFAGVDSPEDVLDSTYQGLFQSGGFVISDQTFMESISLEKLKEVLVLMEKMNRSSVWKWLIHYRENKKLKDDVRVDSVSQLKIILLKSYQQRNIIEVLPYHKCDSKLQTMPGDLPCILNLQNQHIQRRLVVYLTDKPSPLKEEFECNGIIVLDVDRFISKICKLDAQLHLSYW
ncbi:hypothetical protein GDO86_006012 [Hymenochirus boettgeri]|uniref:Protein FAM208B n=1 Tax=Hymenochirus boettgeri TaxID=247094 RepID=A0A8T2J9C2_9PIPI|nr:hypothetical protein GDO86_006012 [Hymenochirus boettgeri]